MTLLALLLACTPSADDSGAGSVPDEAQLSAALVEESPSSILVSWELGSLQVDTVTVHATSDAGDDITMQAAADAGQLVVWGLHAESVVQLEVALVGPDGSWTEDLPELTTAPVPVDFPALQSVGDDLFPGQLLLTTFVLEPPVAVMIDGEGDIRWWRSVKDELPELTRVRFSPDGQSLVGVAANPQGDVAETIARLPLAGGPVELIEIDQAHHDFVFLDDGTLTTLVHEIRDVDGQEMIGDRIVELSPDGQQTVVFDAWEVFNPTPTGANPAGVGFTHANFLVYDADRDDYIVSFFGRWTIDRIDRSSGDLVWELGSSTKADFSTPQGTDWFIEGAHGFELTDDGILYFENGTLDRGLSRVVELFVDEEQRIVEPIWTYDNNDGLYSVSLGDVERLDDGSTIVDFSTNGRIEVVAPSGEVHWSLNADIGGIFGYFELVADPSTGG